MEEESDDDEPTIEDDEENILKEFDYANSGGTGLGPDDITTRFGKYNVFTRYEKVPEVTGLLKFLQYSYLQYVTTQQIELKELKILLKRYFILPDAFLEKAVKQLLDMDIDKLQLYYLAKVLNQYLDEADRKDFKEFINRSDEE